MHVPGVNRFAISHRTKNKFRSIDFLS
jgi:hypothetical protein